MKKIFSLFIVLAFAVGMAACGAVKEQHTDPTVTNNSPSVAEPSTDSTMPSAPAETENTKETEDITQMKMIVKIGDSAFTATLEDNVATRELIEMMKNAPITIDMSDYSGFEKVGPLGRRLTTENHQTITNAGDIVLYNGDQIVIFYGSNSWSYTRIGKIDDLFGWEEALGSGDITAEFSLK
ncbi:MAG: hypothetical protein J1E05_07550 [Eubacterium sp.]|nr:hypothetical protein [Eubacterium sp.]